VAINLEAGLVLDPFLVSVTGGGKVDASTLVTGCAGFINAAPTVTLIWGGQSDFLDAFFYSDYDPMLIVQTPDGEYLCNNDASVKVLDPTIHIERPAAGPYNIWVGSPAAKQWIPGILVLTARPDVNVGNFSLVGLVKRTVASETSAAPVEGERAVVPIQLSTRGVAIAGLQAGGQPVTQSMVISGVVPASELPIPDQQCTGFIGGAPDYAFDWTGKADALRIFFESSQDTTLLVMLPSGKDLCNDDATTSTNLNPMVDVSNPQEGRYFVFVGRLDTETAVKGVLTVSDSTKVRPKTLTR
jgi:hypothetical protein